ncbi:phosphatidate cytidylyltransferase [Dehalobacterium formicoaceticum]|uniref:Phosphatidate cytidylyltransferase n=1 Tax=Dehalobacterium formicoaceticum TaxID=51515 RepID=A0ABT1Y2B8_9FIRM|nr:phosphatidate cytidylyltransferase [Dehalobacterium formicoaceticum]MCR6544703.1 phosphatidate cytidylyltransferase [Dehalobacterium formicoaceticum]
MLWQRILSSVLGIPLVLWVSYQGGLIFRIGVAGIILIGLYEYGTMMRSKGYQVPFISLFAGGLLVLMGAMGVYFLPGGIFFPILLIFIFTVIFKGGNYESSALSLTGLFLFAWTIAHLILIRETFPSGYKYIFLAFVITWTTDTGAYIFGRLLGRHKLAPRISPNKTIEGALGGMLLCLVLVYALKGFFPQITLNLFMALGGIASLLGQMGDLMESAVKRWAGVKDSGNIIPGHGGVLDRFDSLTLVAPLMYYFLKPLIG